MTSDVQVTHNAEQNRYELHKGSELAAFAEYRPAGNAVMLSHTETRPEFEGQGFGSRLVQEMLDTLRAEERQVVPMCPFVASFIREHREYVDLVQPDQRGVFGL
ncbi:N-acetyltransferase [Deinococcus malanensis]|uniref:N-acetyltransferase n=1 Tax=Deinococcus malanensis TaxID=1706855 RepID=A0ABQ2EZ67_9DEIO|nr:GNAT family N-acetyltransferase [Deinococcus malanensis]GGK32797.1 N-acetyltransferase [Deinococcus malanensis]